jgi:hypothetical protein
MSEERVFDASLLTPRSGGCRPGESVEYEVELHSFEEAPSTYSMSAADKKVRHRMA